MKILRHIVISALSLFLILGIPFMQTDYFSAAVNGTEIDAVSSASVIIDQPSGNYLVFINLEKHTDKENLALWQDFFVGNDVTFIFEDIECTVAKSDAAGMTMAESFMSRLPENQMKIKTEDGTLMLSKAEHGIFDIIIMSEELADVYTASTLYGKENIMTIHVEGAAE